MIRAIVLVALLAFPPAALFAAEEKPAPEGPKPPKQHEYSYIYDAFKHSLPRPIARTIDPARLVRRVTNSPREAVNVDASDQVRLPSTWWQPRVGYRTVTAEQMLRGPGDAKGPAPGPWRITKAKTQGITPGFQMKDTKGQLWFIKFDLPAAPELTTSCDVIGSYLYWAAGFNVPENLIATFRAESLTLDKEASYTDRLGRKRPMTREYLDELLTKVARQRDGSFRVLASRALKGKPIGPFEYQGRRKDDPEDLIPHQLRRELRGLWPINAWTNHADSRGPNTLDVWVTDGDRSFVRHHLIDFSGILGSGGLVARSPVTGTEYYVDANVMGRSLITLGLLPFAWEDMVDPQLRSVGFVEAAEFDPVRWRPDYPNPAFDDRTTRDVVWGARIVSAFSDDLIRTAVAAAKYSDPRASEYITQVLIQRRDKISRAWLGTGNGRTAEK